MENKALPSKQIRDLHYTVQLPKQAAVSIAFAHWLWISEPRHAGKGNNLFQEI